MEKEELEAIQKMMTAGAAEIEKRLATSLNKAIEGIDAKVAANAAAAAELITNAKAAVSTMPNLIQEHVEAQLKTNITSIVEEISKQWEGKVREATGGTGAGGSLGIRDLLAESDKIIGIINAWKQPTSDQAMMGQMNFVAKWHQILSKVEKGGGSSEELTNQIERTFVPNTKE